MDWKKRIYCGEVGSSHTGKEILLMGWVDAIRDHGNILFIHLRDNSGIVQIVFDPKIDRKSYESAALLREEYVVEVKGTVCARGKGTENPNLETGMLEVLVHSLKTLSRSKALPFQLSEKAMVFGENIETNPEKVDEEHRLRYRYLDLRRPSVHGLFVKRYEIIKCIREYLDGLNFTEIETPFLTRSTPEGARDYLVPSRVHQGKFYALPQSPQLFKQLLMIGGMDRYFQIARCFRDEDLRPNRQPEFTQLDMEASFINEEFIYEVIEELTVKIFSIGGIDLPRPFPRMTYEQAMNLYGTDRPDLRFEMVFKDLTDILKDTEYGIFRQVINRGGSIKGFCVKGQAAGLSKNTLQNEYAMRIVPGLGARGMSWMKVSDGRLQSNIVQFFSPAEQKSLINRFRAEDGDVLLMIADQSRVIVDKVLCKLRLDIAERLNLIPQDTFCPVWVTDFPLFELKDGSLNSQHHPFTMPDRTDFDPSNREEMLSLNSRAYDLVMNGEELGGGSIRIHRMDIQNKVFQALGLSSDEVENKFGFFLRALEYGAPPHGGIALGMDRVISMILKTDSIRDIIAFPKNRSAYCPLTQAPSTADKSQLMELGLDSSSEILLTEEHEQAVSEKKPAPSPETCDRISEKEVYHVAKLARLKLTDPEVKKYKKDLNSILGYFETLQELDTQDIEPMSHVQQMKNVWRNDIPRKNKDTDPLLANAPMKEKNYYKVPRIIES